MTHFALLILFSSILFGQQFSLGKAIELSYKGDIAYSHWSLPNVKFNNVDKSLNRFSGSLDLTLQGDFDYQVRLNTRVLIDPKRKNLNRYEIDDFYFDWYNDSYEVRSGYQIFSWKTVESISHADFLNQTDVESDLFDPEKFGELAIRTRYNFDTETEQTLEFYYLPYLRTTNLPSTHNPYRFLNLSNSESRFAFESSSKKWRPQIAIRYQTILFENVDFNVFLFDGYNRFPSLYTTSKSEVSHNYKTLNKYGLSFQGELGQWLLKGEFVYNYFHKESINLYSRSIQPKYLSYTTGFEYTLYAPFFSNQDLGIIIELIGDTDTGKSPAELEGFRPYQNNIFLGLRYAFNTISNRSILFGAFIDYLDDNSMLQLEYEERFFENFKVKINLNIINTKTAPLDTFVDRDRFKVDMSYHF